MNGHPLPRRGGFAPLESYAVLGDGRTVALVAEDGRIDWWPVPTIDAPPLLAATLDPERGGWWSLCPEEPASCTRRYLPGTNVLETTWRTPSGVARTTEALATGRAGRLPWTELTRRVDGVEGEVAMRFELVPGDRFDTTSPWCSQRGTTATATIGDQTVAVLVDARDGGGVVVEAHRISGRLVVAAGERALVAAVASDHEPLYLSPPEAIADRLERTADGWRRWSDGVRAPERWAEPVRRSALALKSLLYEPGGAIAAAATTSLPERVGGPKNWDYRYAWVRDSSFTVDAFIALGLHEEVQAAVSWLLGALRRSAPRMEVFYTLEGEVPTAESDLDVPGYRGSRPVRAGNDARGQVQLGTYGDLFETVWRYVSGGHLLDEGTAAQLAALASQCCDRWRARDSGIWELPDLAHFTISKMGCWVALDRAARLAEAGHLPDREAPRWRHEAATIHDWVDRHCWSDRLGAWTMAAGDDRLDAAALLAGRTGFDRGERLASTIDAVRRQLADGPLVWRYTGMREEEGAFVACSFWLAEAMSYAGDPAGAAQVLDDAVALANDVGILAEQALPGGVALGNLPQGLSHLALVNAAFAVSAGLEGRPAPGEAPAAHSSPTNSATPSASPTIPA